MIKNIITMAKILRIADAFSELTRGGFLNRQIQEKKLFDKLNPTNDKKIKDKIIIFIADLIDQIIFHYIDKSQSDLIQWFINEFAKSNSHLQDIMEYNLITQQDIINHNKKAQIPNLNNFIIENGSCINILTALQKFKRLNKQLPKQNQIKIKDLDFIGLINFVQSNQKNLTEINSAGQPKTLEKVNIPNVSSYKVYKCYPPKDKNNWRQCPQFIQLNEKFSKKAVWCVIQGGGIQYGHYLDPKWNFYVLVTTNNNQPVMFFNFAQNNASQIKNIHNGVFSSYNEQLFNIVDWFVKKYNFDTSRASQFQTYEKIKNIYQNQTDKSTLKQIYKSNNYTFFKDEHQTTNNYYYVYNNKNQCKFLIIDGYYSGGNLIRIGKKEKISEQIIDFLVNQKCKAVIRNLIEKKILQKQNGILYIKSLKFMLEQGGGSDIYSYLYNGDIMDDIMPFNIAIKKLKIDDIKKLLNNNRVAKQNLRYCFKQILDKKNEDYFEQLLRNSNFQNEAFDYIKDDLKPMNKFPYLSIYKNLNGRNLIISNKTNVIIASYTDQYYKLFQSVFLQQQVEYFIEQQMSVPLMFLLQKDEIKNNQQLVNKINENVDMQETASQLIQNLCNGDLQKQTAENILESIIKNKNEQLIQEIIDHYHADMYYMDINSLYDYVSASNDANLIYDYLNNKSLVYADDTSWETVEGLISNLATLNRFDLITRLDYDDRIIAQSACRQFISSGRFSDALVAMDYLDSQEANYQISYYLDKASDLHDAQAIGKIFEHFNNYHFESIQQPANFDNAIDCLIEQDSHISVFYSDLSETNRDYILDYLINNDAKTCIKYLIEQNDKLNQSERQRIAQFAIDNQYVDLMEKISLQDFYQPFIQDIVTFMTEHKKFKYLLQNIDDLDDYGIIDQIYENGNKEDLFGLGCKETLDNNKTNYTNDEILEESIFNFINKPLDPKDVNTLNMNNQLSDIILYSKHNSINKNILFNIVKRILDEKLMDKKQGFDTFVIGLANNKLLQPNQNLFNLLYQNKQFSIIINIEEFASQYDKIKQLVDNAEDLQFNITDINVKEAINVLSDQQLAKYLSEKQITHDETEEIINKRLMAMINLIINYKKHMPNRIDEVLLIMKNSVIQNIDKNICKQYCDIYRQKIGQDLIKAILSIGEKKLKEQDKQIIDDFTSYMKDTLKLSKKLYKISKIISQSNKTY